VALTKIDRDESKISNIWQVQKYILPKKYRKKAFLDVRCHSGRFNLLARCTQVDIDQPGLG